jgi:beta-lactamase regulating signal transducer with metallopeptidase domain
MASIPTNQSLNTQLANAVAAVATAQDNLQRMTEIANSARREETDARNRVNEAQKHFDALVAEVKKSAPRDTCWRQPVGLPAGA